MEEKKEGGRWGGVREKELRKIEMGEKGRERKGREGRERGDWVVFGCVFVLSLRCLLALRWSEPFCSCSCSS